MESLFCCRERATQVTGQLSAILFILVPYKTVSYFKQAFLISKRLSLDPERIPPLFKLLYAILAYEMVKMIIFNFLPCSKGTQVIWFDYFTFAGMPENFNLTFAVMYYQFAYFYQVCYFQSYLNGSTVTMYKVLVLQQVRPVFLSTKYQGKYEVTAFVRRLYLAILNYQQVNVISLGKIKCYF